MVDGRSRQTQLALAARGVLLALITDAYSARTGAVVVASTTGVTIIPGPPHGTATQVVRRARTRPVGAYVVAAGNNDMRNELLTSTTLLLQRLRQKQITYIKLE